MTRSGPRGESGTASDVDECGHHITHPKRANSTSTVPLCGATPVPEALDNVSPTLPPPEELIAELRSVVRQLALSSEDGWFTLDELHAVWPYDQRLRPRGGPFRALLVDGTLERVGRGPGGLRFRVSESEERQMKADMAAVAALFRTTETITLSTLYRASELAPRIPASLRGRKTRGGQRIVAGLTEEQAKRCQTAIWILLRHKNSRKLKQRRAYSGAEIHALLFSHPLAPAELRFDGTAWGIAPLIRAARDAYASRTAQVRNDIDWARVTRSAANDITAVNALLDFLATFELIPGDRVHRRDHVRFPSAWLKLIDDWHRDEAPLSIPRLVHLFTQMHLAGVGNPRRPSQRFIDYVHRANLPKSEQSRLRSTYRALAASGRINGPEFPKIRRHPPRHPMAWSEDVSHRIARGEPVDTDRAGFDSELAKYVRYRAASDAEIAEAGLPERPEELATGRMTGEDGSLRDRTLGYHLKTFSCLTGHAESILERKVASLREILEKPILDAFTRAWNGTMNDSHYYHLIRGRQLAAYLHHMATEEEGDESKAAVDLHHILYRWSKAERRVKRKRPKRTAASLRAEAVATMDFWWSGITADLAEDEPQPTAVDAWRTALDALEWLRANEVPLPSHLLLEELTTNRLRMTDDLAAALRDLEMIQFALVTGIRQQEARAIPMTEVTSCLKAHGGGSVNLSVPAHVAKTGVTRTITFNPGCVYDPAWATLYGDFARPHLLNGKESTQYFVPNTRTCSHQAEKDSRMHDDPGGAAGPMLTSGVMSTSIMNRMKRVARALRLATPSTPGAGALYLFRHLLGTVLVMAGTQEDIENAAAHLGHDPEMTRKVYFGIKPSSGGAANRLQALTKKAQQAR